MLNCTCGIFTGTNQHSHYFSFLDLLQQTTRNLATVNNMNVSSYNSQDQNLRISLSRLKSWCLQAIFSLKALGESLFLFFYIFQQSPIYIYIYIYIYIFFFFFFGIQPFSPSLKLLCYIFSPVELLLLSSHIFSASDAAFTLL